MSPDQASTWACWPPGWVAFAVLGASWWQLLTAAYVEASLFGSYAEAVRHLHAVGAPLRPTVAAAD